MCHGVSAPTPLCNVHQTVRMHHGAWLGQRKKFGRCMVLQIVHWTGPKRWHTFTQMTYLHTDGMNDANFILVCWPKVLRKFIMVQVTVVVLSFAAPCYNSLCCQIYDVCKTSVGTKNSEVLVNVIVCGLTWCVGVSHQIESQSWGGNSMWILEALCHCLRHCCR